jgi:nucleotide-binding universal stress UspA family protein
MLLPTDFQQSARRAFLYGVKLAIGIPARLEILHVIKAPVDGPNAARDSRYLRSVKTAALLNLGRLTEAARAKGAQAQPLLRYGVPAACILEVVKQVHAEMIVIGTEGRTGWDRLRLGSTAEAVVREAPCPVLTVHGGLAGDAPGHPARIRLRRLLVATDFSVYAGAALHAVARLAATLDARVCLLHAAEPAADGKPAERRLAKLVQELRYQHIEAESVCAVGDPVETILIQAAAWQADLIAVGTQGRRGLSRLMLGSVAEALLKRAGCPVLTVAKQRRPHARDGRSRGRMAS